MQFIGKLNLPGDWYMPTTEEELLPEEKLPSSYKLTGKVIWPDGTPFLIRDEPPGAPAPVFLVCATPRSRWFADMEMLRRLALQAGSETLAASSRKEPSAEEAAIPWNPDAWEELQPLPRRLLQHMLGRDRDTIANIAEKVWGTDGTSEGAIDVAINRANQFLQKQGDTRVLSKLRGAGVICWK